MCFAKSRSACGRKNWQRLCELIRIQSTKKGALSSWSASIADFRPLAVRMKSFLAEVQEPLALNYRVNAGFLPSDHWVHDPEQGGGRLLGEVCHFVDFLAFLADLLRSK